MQEEEHPIMEENAKKIRRRKKNLFNSILQQMEFYFSDANIRKDRFISQLIQKNPYVELSTFLNFNKIVSLTTKIEDIALAIEKSEILQLSEDRTKVCRTTPIQEKLNEDACTIYVERLPEDTQHDWLKEIFSSFGSVDYVSLPKYKHNKRHKGFAFIEFSDVESAEKAINYFESIGCKLPTQMPPNQLISIVTFEPDNQQPNLPICEPIIIPNNQESIINSTEMPNKKRKFSSDDEKEDSSKKIKIEEKENDEEEKKNGNEEKTDDEKNEDEEKNEEENSEGQKKKRKRKKNKKSAFDFRQMGLQVLAKKEWKQLRNKYLNMQRLKMKTLKEHLYRSRNYRTPEYNNENYDEERNDKSNQQEKVESEPRFKYSPGCIIRFTIPENCSDSKKLKNDIRQQPGVEFVDIHPGKTIGYIRFSNNETADQFFTSSFLESMAVLEGAQEAEYWEKITKDREAKLKKAPMKKVRGRDKLLKKAEQELGKHIRFE